MAKKKNSRKALAVALGIMGVAGLSVASASTLDVTPGNEVAIGTSTTAFASCDADGAVGIEYTYGAGPNYYIDSVTITGIDAACNGEDFRFSIENTETGASPITGSDTLAFGASPSGDQSVVVTTISPATVPISDDLGTATVIIG